MSPARRIARVARLVVTVLMLTGISAFALPGDASAQDPPKCSERDVPGCLKEGNPKQPDQSTKAPLPTGRPCSEGNVPGCIKDGNPRPTQPGPQLVPTPELCSKGNLPGCIKDGNPKQPDQQPSDSCGFSISCLVQSAAFTIFGGDRGWVTAPYLRWLIRVPDLAGSEGAVRDAGNVTRAAAWALLLGLVTFSVFYYYVSGLMSSAGGGALTDAILRSTGAALFILAWPWIFQSGVAITDTLSDAIVPGAQLEAITTSLMAMIGIGAVFAGHVALLFAIIIALAFALLSLALYILKLGLTAGLLISYLTVPLAVALWAVPAMSRPASYALRYCAAAASTQVTWALCLMALGALAKDTVLLSGGGPWTDAIQKPLFGIAILAAMLVIPRHTFRAWGLDSAGTGAVIGQVALGLGMSFARSAGRAGGAGGAGGAGTAAAKGTVEKLAAKESAPGAHAGNRSRADSRPSGSSGEGSNGKGSGDSSGDRAGGQARGGQGSGGQAQAGSGSGSGSGYRDSPPARRDSFLESVFNPPGNEGKQVELFRDRVPSGPTDNRAKWKLWDAGFERRKAGVTPAQANAAAKTIGKTQHGGSVRGLITHGGASGLSGTHGRDAHIVRRMAEASGNGELTPPLRDAFLTLGAASSEIRHEAAERHLNHSADPPSGGSAKSDGSAK